MPVAPATGRTVAGKYRLLDRVGVGGMSEVFRAETIDTGRIVALKLLLPQRVEDPNLAARLFHEAHSGFRIRHPAIVDVLDVGQGEVGPFIAMEFLNGLSASRALVDNGKFPLDAAVGTLLPVLDALQAAHDAGVVHRDLKPGNVFFSIDESGELYVKLLDFGVAKTLWPSGPTPRTSTGVVMGTPDYLSPEQAHGDANIDGRSDVFGTGVVLFELLTATRPFHAPTAVATAYKIAHARTPLLRDYGGPADSTVQAIMERALAKRPEERYATAREFAAELTTLSPSMDTRRRALRSVVKPEAVLREISSSGMRPVRRNDDTERDSGIELSSLRSRGLIERTPVSTRLSGTPSARARENRAGTPQVRGSVLRSVDQYVKQVFGSDARARVLAKLPSDVAQEFDYDTIQAIVLYGVDAANRYLEIATRELAHGNTSWARSAGSTSVTGELGPLFRNTLRSDALPAVVRRVLPVMSRLLDFGCFEIEVSGSVTSLRVTDFEPAGGPLRLWFTGVLDGALSASGARARTTIARGESAFSPHLVVDVVSG
jgi:serine/threonine protein kinase